MKVKNNRSCKKQIEIFPLLLNLGGRETPNNLLTTTVGYTLYYLKIPVLIPVFRKNHETFNGFVHFLLIITLLITTLTGTKIYYKNKNKNEE